jgi:DNA helicase HerA-like ATPase
MKFGVNDCFTVLGTRGCGKSYLSRKINKLWPRRIIIDPVGEFKEGKIFTDFNLFSAELIKLKKENAKEFELIIQFDPDKIDHEATFNAVLKLCFHYKNLQVYIDEIQMFSSPHYLPHYLKQILFIGRHHGISLICVTQRPGQLNKNILSQSTHIFAGQLHEKNDLNYIGNFLGVDAEKLINLPKREFIYFSPGEKIKIIKS